ncbi:MAG TPA: TIR domain-containing protein, partial [Verrucomicrobiales bacterium]|nr:TIR domain-containing protein [Verrucomicrobiales bacterium]
EKWGRWLHRGIEGYKIPKGLIGRDTRYGQVPKRLFPVFRDREELPTASDLSKIINQALIDSSHLIVICSPNSAKSQWVNEEVMAFKKLGKQNRILCLIVDGEPNAANKPELGLEECFPSAVKVAADEDGNLTDIEAEPIAADAREGKDGKANALMKVFAGMMGVGFDEIKQRDLARKQKRAALVGTASLILALVMGILSVWAIGNKNIAVAAKEDSDKQRLLAEQSRDEAERLLAQPATN